MLEKIVGYFIIILIEALLALLFHLTIKHDEKRIKKWLDAEIEKAKCWYKN